MPFERPTLTDLQAQARTDIATRLPGSDPQPRRSNLGALGAVMAAGDHGQHGYLVWHSRQLMPDTAEAEHLERHAGFWGVARKPAVAATGSLTVAGTTGALIPAGTVWRRSDNTELASTSEQAIAAGVATVPVAASLAGAAGNTEAGAKLYLVSPVAGAANQATVDSGGLAGGLDEEADDYLRARVLARLRVPPNGGASDDYVNWALLVPGVTRAWCYPGRAGAGTVGVAFLNDDRADPIPTVDEVAAMQAHLDALRPVTAQVAVFALATSPLNPNIHLRTTDTTSVRAAVQAELADLMRREALPEGTLWLSRIREAISAASGEHDHVLNSPVADVTATAGHITTLGTITWS